LVTESEYRVSIGWDDFRIRNTEDDMRPFEQLLLHNLHRCCPGGGMWKDVPQDGTYSSISNFLRTHGRIYQGKWTGRWKPAARRDRYLNAMTNSLAHGLRFVEGIAFSAITYPEERRGIWTPITHTWNADESGALVDTTTSNGSLAYFGVEFSVDRAYEAWAYGNPETSEVIWDEQREWPILQHLWLGDDESRFPRRSEIDDLRGKPVQHVKRELKLRLKQLSSKYAHERDLEKQEFVRWCRQDMVDRLQQEKGFSTS
jgi:hypothetical protein